MFDINREHPDYASQRAIWRQYQDMYVGGEHFKCNADRYLVRRQKEPADVYGERLIRVFYENYIGSIIDWYTATIFRREPIFSFEGPNERARRFFSSFTEDCDLKGTECNGIFPGTLYPSAGFWKEPHPGRLPPVGAGRKPR